MDELLQVLTTYDWGGDRNALGGIAQRVAQVHADPDLRAPLEAGFVGILESAAPLPAKEFVCRRLAMIGTAASVPALGAMLGDEATNNMARMALEQIPDAAAGEKLREALPSLTGLPRVGAIASLGQRGETAAVGMLGGLLGDADEAAAVAAAQALGQIADDRSAEALAGALASASGQRRVAVLDAYLRCADRCVATGARDKARAIYTAVSQSPDTTKGIAMAAAQGLGRFNAEGATS